MIIPNGKYNNKKYEYTKDGTVIPGSNIPLKHYSTANIVLCDGNITLYVNDKILNFVENWKGTYAIKDGKFTSTLSLMDGDRSIGFATLSGKIPESSNILPLLGKWAIKGQSGNWHFNNLFG
jgi:hypothetical protein